MALPSKWRRPRLQNAAAEKLNTKSKNDKSQIATKVRQYGAAAKMAKPQNFRRSHNIYGEAKKRA